MFNSFTQAAAAKLKEAVVSLDTPSKAPLPPPPPPPPSNESNNHNNNNAADSDSDLVALRMENEALKKRLEDSSQLQTLLTAKTVEHEKLLEKSKELMKRYKELRNEREKASSNSSNNNVTADQLLLKEAQEESVKLHQALQVQKDRWKQDQQRNEELEMLTREVLPQLQESVQRLEKENFELKSLLHNKDNRSENDALLQTADFQTELEQMKEHVLRLERENEELRAHQVGHTEELVVQNREVDLRVQLLTLERQNEANQARLEQELESKQAEWQRQVIASQEEVRRLEVEKSQLIAAQNESLHEKLQQQEEAFRTDLLLAQNREVDLRVQLERIVVPKAFPPQEEMLQLETKEKELHQQVESMNNSVKEAHQEKVELQAKLDLLTSREQDLVQEVARLTNESSTAVCENPGEEIATLQNEINRLCFEREMEQDRSQEIAHWQQQARELKAKLEQANAKAEQQTDLDDALKEKNETIQRHENLLVEEQVHSRALSDQVQIASERLLTLESENENLKSKLERLGQIESEYADVHAKLEGVAGLQAENAELKSKLERLGQVESEHAAGLHAENAELKSNLERLRQIESECGDLHAKLEGFSGENAELKSKLERLGQLENEYADLHAKELNNLSGLQAENSELKSKLESASGLQAENAELKSKLERLGQMESEHADLHAKLDTLSGLNAENAELKSKLEHLSVLDSQNKDLHTKLDRLQLIETEHAELQSQLEHLSALDVENKHLHLKVNRLSDLESENQALQTQLERLTVLDVENQELQSRLSRLIALEKDHQLLQVELDRLAYFQEENHALQQREIDLRIDVDRLERASQKQQPAMEIEHLARIMEEEKLGRELDLRIEMERTERMLHKQVEKVQEELERMKLEHRHDFSHVQNREVEARIQVERLERHLQQHQQQQQQQPPDNVEELLNCQQREVELRVVVDQSERKIGSLQARIHTLEKEQGELIVKRNELFESLMTCQETVENLGSKFDAVQESHSMLQIQLQESQMVGEETRLRLQSEFDQMKADMTTLFHDKAKQLETELSTAKQEAEASSLACLGMQNQVRVLQEESSKAARESDGLKERTKQALLREHAEKKELEEELSKVKQRLALVSATANQPDPAMVQHIARLESEHASFAERHDKMVQHFELTLQNEQTISLQLQRTVDEHVYALQVCTRKLQDKEEEFQNMIKDNFIRKERAQQLLAEQEAQIDKLTEQLRLDPSQLLQENLREENATYRQLLHDKQAELLAAEADVVFLRNKNMELSHHNTATSPRNNDSNAVYLKNILVSYMACANASEQLGMVKVIAQLVGFSPEETGRIRHVLESQSGSVLGMLAQNLLGSSSSSQSSTLPTTTTTPSRVMKRIG